MNKKGCELIQHGISFEKNDIYDCCITHGAEQRGMPLLIRNYNGETIDWDKIFETKRERIKKQQEKTIWECEGCYALEDYDFTNEEYISFIAFNQIKLCNAKCIYCGDDFRNVLNYYDVLPVIKDLINKGKFRNTGEVTFQGGEPTLINNFDELLKLFTDLRTRVRIHSSGIKYSPEIQKGIEEGLVTVVISLDSGTKEIYEKIKNVKMFEKVIENIKKYSEVLNESNKNNLRLKYVITPGYNDTIKDIDNWFKIIEKFNIKSIAMDIEVQYANKHNQKDVSPHIYMLMDYIKYKAELMNLNFITYSFAIYVLNARKFFKYQNFIKNKFLYNLIALFHRHKNKHKNIEYAQPTNNMIQ